MRSGVPAWTGYIQYMGRDLIWSGLSASALCDVVARYGAIRSPLIREMIRFMGK